MSVPAPTPPSPVTAPTASAWGGTAKSVIGPITIKSSTGKYMYFNTVDQQAIASTFDVSLSDAPQLFLFTSQIPDIQKIPTNVGNPYNGTLFPAYVQTDGSLWAYASSGFNTTTGANTPGEKHMILSPFQQTATNYNTPYSQSFGWNFWANSDGTYNIQNVSTGYASPSSDGTKILLGASAIEKWTIDYVSYPPPPPADPLPEDAQAPSPATDNSLWIWIGVGVGILLLFILLIVVLMSSSKKTRGK